MGTSRAEQPNPTPVLRDHAVLAYDAEAVDQWVSTLHDRACILRSAVTDAVRTAARIADIVRRITDGEERINRIARRAADNTVGGPTERALTAEAREGALAIVADMRRQLAAVYRDAAWNHIEAHPSPVTPPPVTPPPAVPDPSGLRSRRAYRAEEAEEFMGATRRLVDELGHQLVDRTALVVAIVDRLGTVPAGEPPEGRPTGAPGAAAHSGDQDHARQAAASIVGAAGALVADVYALVDDHLLGSGAPDQAASGNVKRTA